MTTDPNRDELNNLLKQCWAEDPIDRYDAFEEVSNVILHQGSPSSESPWLVTVVLDWIARGHPDWVDLVDFFHQITLNLTAITSRGRPPFEDVRRQQTLEAIKAGENGFVSIFEKPCQIKDGKCQIHAQVAEILDLIGFPRLDWLTKSATELVRSKPAPHSQLWSLLQESGLFGSLSNGDLYSCVNREAGYEPGHDPIALSALFHLGSRGDTPGLNGLRRAMRLASPYLVPSSEQAAILVANPGSVALDVLLPMYDRAVDFRAAHDLACGILRNIAGDQRSGWDVVVEERLRDGLRIRHPNVDPIAAGFIVPEVTRNYGRIVRGKRQIRAIDTDIWRLFGL